MPGDLLDVGRVVRPHGLRGEVVVELWTNRSERMSVGSRLQSPERELQVAAARPLLEGGRRDRWVVAFDGITDRPGAEKLRGAQLQAAPLDVEDALWVHEMIGSEVCDEDGSPIGVVESVQANPASDLLVLGDGRLIPLIFVVRAHSGRLTVSAPPGLLDL